MDSDRFKAIRPYNDNEVKPALERLLDNEQLIPFVNSLLGKSLPGKGFTFQILEREFKNIDSVQKFQQAVIGPYVGKLVQNTIEEVTLSGLENLVKEQGYLFISNHRDIVMDPTLINYFLHVNGYETAQMVVGDNLFSMPLVEQFFRLNKGIILKRRLPMKEQYKEWCLLSDYIDEQVQARHSLWMSQMEGRAQDGNDRTNPALINVLSISQRKNAIKLSDYINSLNIIPVAVSYEYNPCDSLMSEYLFEKSKNKSHLISLKEYENIMLTGIKGPKGRVHISFGEPVRGNFQTPKDVAAAIDKQIMSNYHLWESNYTAFELSGGILPKGVVISNEKRQEFIGRLTQIPKEHQPYLIKMYANPVKNQL